MNLTWAICNRDGDEKDWLWTREGGEVELLLNDQGTATVTVSSEEKVSGQIHPGRTRMKIRAQVADQSILIANMLLTNPRGSWLTTEIPMIDQSFRLINAHHAKVYDFDTGDTFEPDSSDVREVSEQMWYMINRADKRTRELNSDDAFFAGDPAPEIGIIQGTLQDTGHSKLWDAFDVQTTWDSLKDMAKRIDGPDFELTPLDREDGVHAELNTFYPRKGEIKDDIIFELGYTVSDLTWEPSIVDPGLCNRYILVGEGAGASAPVYVAENKGSIKALGLYSRIESAPSDMELEEYEARAKAYIANRAWPVNFFDMILPAEIGGQAVGWNRDANGDLVQLGQRGEFGVPPACFVEYGLGDIVTVRAQDLFSFGIADEDPGPQTDYQVRVTGIKLTEVDNDGNVVVTLTAQPHEEDADQTGYQGRISVDNS